MREAPHADGMTLNEPTDVPPTKGGGDTYENHHFSGKADADGYGFIYLQYASAFYGENRSPDALDPESLL